MKKRLKKKLRKELTEEELLVIELYRGCTEVSFSQDCADDDEAFKLAEQLGKVKKREYWGFNSYAASKGKIEVHAYAFF